MSAQAGPTPKAMKVALFGSYAPSLINFRGPLISALVERGHRVFAIAPDIGADVAKSLEALGVTPVAVSLGRTSLSPFGTMRTARELEAQLRDLEPDLLIAYTVKPITIGGPAAKAAGVPRFVPLITGMGYPFLGGLHPKRILIRLITMAMYRRALARAAFVIFQNADDRSDFTRLRLLPRTVPSGIVNGSGVDVDHFAQRPVPEAPVFLMVSRFLRDKGIREYGDAAARLKQEYPHARFLLAGWLDESPDSISPEELDRIIAGGVEPLGRLDDVRPALETCSVYVLPSYREGTPRSVLEAMAVGRAIVTTDAPGCRETVVEGRNGHLVSPRDANALHAAMRNLIERPELRSAMGEESRRLVVQKYDVRKVNDSILELLDL